MNSRTIFIFFLLFVLSSQDCFPNCEECIENSTDDKNMKCLSCKNGFNMLLNTQNCVDKKEYPSFFSFQGILSPCETISNNTLRMRSLFRSFY